MKLLSTRLLLLAIAVFILGCSGQEHSIFRKKSAAPPVNPHLQAFVDEYARYFAGEMHRSQTPGAAVVIVQDTSILFMKGFGVKAVHGRDSVGVNTVFRIGSVSKGFAAVLTGILVQDSLLNWNDPVVKYVPYFALRSPEQSQRVTIRHILSHSSGLPYHTFTNLIEAGQDIPTITGRLKEVRLVGKEGEVFSYQNATFSIIEEVMRAVTGKSYAHLLKDKIFKPAGMKHASATYEGIQRTRNKAYPHEGWDSAWVRTEITTKFYNATAAGGVNASISDMAQWLFLLLGNKPEVVSRATLDTIFQPVIKTNNERRFFSEWLGDKEAFYGMGWRILHTPADTIIYHGGYVNSYKSELALYPRDKIAVCILFNGAGSMSNSVIPAFFELYSTYADSVRTWKPEIR